MKLVLALALVTVVSCGADNGGGGANLVDPDTTEQPQDGQTTDLSAQLVATQAAAPVCDQAAEGRLIYVQDEKVFKSCAAGAYAVIALDIPKGEKGDKGDAGVDGEKGEQGEAGEDGVAQSANTWLDPISGKTWLVGGTTNAGAGCTGNPLWRLPTYSEISVARGNGMWAGFAPLDLSSEYECGAHSDGGFNRNEVKPGATCGAMWGIYCVQID